MEVLPNIHVLGMLTMVYTLVYRKKALFPIYVYVLLNGVFSGFATWWIPYLYIWTILWAVTMLLPKNLSPKKATFVYMLICSLHGFLYGVLYAPFQALAFGLSFKGTLTWIASGLPFDAIHGVSNFFLGMLILPLTKLLRKLTH
jgi:energy-coupling factor transport system substrate-specific component